MAQISGREKTMTKRQPLSTADKDASQEPGCLSAILRGNWAEALALIEAGVGVRAVSVDGSTTLMAILEGFGSVSGEEEMAAARRAALACISGVDAQARRGDGWTAMAMACARGEHQIIEALEEVAGHGRSQSLRSGASLLMLAAQSGSQQAVAAALRLGLGSVDDADKRDQPAMLWASEALDESALLALAPSDLGAWRLPGGKTLLMAAIEKNAYHVARALMGLRRWDEQDERGDTALAIAARRGSVEILRALADKSDPKILNDAGQSALMQAAQGARLGPRKECVEIMLDVCDPAQRDHLGRSALEMAIVVAAAAMDMSSLFHLDNEQNPLGAVEALARATQLSTAASNGEVFSAFAHSMGNEEIGRLVERLALVQRENIEISEAIQEPGRAGRPRAL